MANELDEYELQLKVQKEKAAKALHKLTKLATALKMTPEALHAQDLEAKEARHKLKLGLKTVSICWRRRGLMEAEIAQLTTVLDFNRLIHRECIQCIDLWTNCIGRAGSSMLCESLRHSKTLTTLNLGENSLGDEGAIAVASLLHDESTLRTLDLRSNHISVPGVTALAVALECNTSLTQLGLGFNQLCHAGLRPLATIAFGHLQDVDIRNNIIDARACRVLAAGIVANQRNLRRLDVRQNDVMSREATSVLGKAAKDRTRRFKEIERAAKRKAYKEKRKYHPGTAPPELEFYWVEPRQLRPLPGDSKAAAFVASHVCAVS